MFGMIPLIKSLALTQSRLLTILLADYKKRSGHQESSFVKEAEELEKDMHVLLRQLGIK